MRLHVVVKRSVPNWSGTGYRIVRHYYEQAADKAAALATILGLTDFEGFLARSGYAGR